MCLANELRCSLADCDFSVLSVLCFPWKASQICLAKQVGRSLNWFTRRLIMSEPRLLYCVVFRPCSVTKWDVASNIGTETCVLLALALGFREEGCGVSLGYDLALCSSVSGEICSSLLEDGASDFLLLGGFVFLFFWKLWKTFALDIAL